MNALKKINKLSKINTLITIILCVILSLFVDNFLILATLFIIIDFLISQIEWVEVKSIIKKYCTTKKEYDDLFFLLKNYCFFCEKKIINYLQSEKENITNKKSEETLEEIFENKINYELIEFNDINSKLNETLEKISDDHDILLNKKKIKKHIKNIKLLVNQEPYKINNFLSKYRIIINGFIECLVMYEKSIDKKIYEEKLIFLSKELLEYLSNTEERLKIEEQVNLNSLMNVLISELKKENQQNEGNEIC